MKARVRVTWATEDGREFFGAGVAELLERIGEEKSIQGAARGMGLSYVKALRILRGAEEGLGASLVLRRKGGAERGGAELTDAARAALGAYGRVREAANRAASEALEKESAAKCGRTP